MATRWRFNSVQTDTKNVARIRSVSFRFGRDARIVIDVEKGEVVDDNFVVKERQSVEMDKPFSAQVTTLMENIVTRALTFLVNKGIIPAGTEEAEPIPVNPPR